MNRQAIKERVQQLKEINERLRTFKDGAHDMDLGVNIQNPPQMHFSFVRS